MNYRRLLPLLLALLLALLGCSDQDVTPGSDATASLMPTDSTTLTATTQNAPPTMTPTLSPTQTPLPTATPTPWLVAGTVRDAETGKPLADAKLVWDAAEVETGADGAYAFHQPPAAAAPLVVRHAGYLEGRVDWQGERQLDIALEPRWLVLTVFDPTSFEALPEVRVTANDAEALTDERGKVLLARLEPGTAIRLEMAGYTPGDVTYQGQEEITWPLRPVTFHGRLVDRLTEEPVAGAQLIWRSQEGATRQSVSLDDGSYAISAVTAPAVLSIRAAGYLSATLDITTTVAAPITTTLEPFVVKGVYVPYGVLYLPDRLQSILDLVEATELNAIVVDVKSDRGRIAHQSQVEIAVQGEALHPDMADLNELVQYCHARGIYAIARMVIFKDPVLTAVRPDLAIHRQSGEMYVDLEGLTWANPYLQEVYDYNIALAKEIVAIGFDEIQFDYLRFPSDGVTRDLAYPVESNMATRTAAIGEFMSQVHDALKPLGVMISADLFGLTLWVADDRDLGIGQRLIDIAPHVDYISPMVYPSTFTKGNLNLDNPSAHPYEVVYRSCVKAQERTSTKIRPWLQHYWGDAEYYLEEKRGAEEAKAHGWLFWNAAGKYTEPTLFDPAPAQGN